MTPHILRITARWALAFLAASLLPFPCAHGAAPASAAPVAEGWRDIFDGSSLSGWRVTPFAGHGDVVVEKGEIHLPLGVMLTGVNYTNPTPRIDYEVSLQAMRTDGSDFFCGLTFPVGTNACSLIVGGWGGGVVGLSSLDGYDASENETTKYQQFEKNHWYAIRLRVTQRRIKAWIDNEAIVDALIEGRRVSLRSGEIELSAPFGIASWQTGAALKNLKIRPLTPDEIKASGPARKPSAP